MNNILPENYEWKTNIDINIIISRYSMRNVSSIGASKDTSEKSISTEDIF